MRPDDPVDNRPVDNSIDDPIDNRVADKVDSPMAAADVDGRESFREKDTPVQEQAGGVVVNGEERAMVEHDTEPDVEQPVAENAGDHAGADKDASSQPESAADAPSVPRPTSARVPRPARPRPAHAFPTQSVAAPPVTTAAFGTTLAPQPAVRTDVAPSVPVVEQPEDAPPQRGVEAASEPAPEIAPEIEQDTAAASAPAHTPTAEAATQVVEPAAEAAPVPQLPASLPQHQGAGEDFAPIHALLESLLFVAAEPVPIGQLARTLELDEPAIHAALQELAEIYARQNRGLRVQAYREKYQIVTAPAAAAHIERFLNLDSSSKLSGPALETLAVVAYRQPVTRSQIEAVRGVDCAAVLRSLVQRGLVEEVGRLDVAGRPFLYGVTDLFMQHFGLTDLAELPPLEQTEADALWATTALAELEGDAEAVSADGQTDAPLSQPPAAEDRAA